MANALGREGGEKHWVKIPRILSFSPGAEDGDCHEFPPPRISLEISFGGNHHRPMYKSETTPNRKASVAINIKVDDFPKIMLIYLSLGRL